LGGIVFLLLSPNLEELMKNALYPFLITALVTLGCASTAADRGSQENNPSDEPRMTITLTQDSRRLIHDVKKDAAGEWAYLYSLPQGEDPEARYVSAGGQDYGPFWDLGFWHPGVSGQRGLIVRGEVGDVSVEIGEERLGPVYAVTQAVPMAGGKSLAYVTLEVNSTTKDASDYYVYYGEKRLGPFGRVGPLQASPIKEEIAFNYTEPGADRRDRKFYPEPLEVETTGYGGNYVILLAYGKDGREYYTNGYGIYADGVFLELELEAVGAYFRQGRGRDSNYQSAKDSFSSGRVEFNGEYLGMDPIFRRGDWYFIGDNPKGLYGMHSHADPTGQSRWFLFHSLEPMEQGKENLKAYGFPIYSPRWEQKGLIGVHPITTRESSLLYYNGGLHGPFPEGRFIFAPGGKDFLFAQDGFNSYYQVRYRDKAWGQILDLQEVQFTADGSRMAFIGRVNAGFMVLHEDQSYGPYPTVSYLRLSQSGESVAYLVLEEGGRIVFYKDGRQTSVVNEGAYVHNSPGNYHDRLKEFREMNIPPLLFQGQSSVVVSGNMLSYSQRSLHGEYQNSDTDFALAILRDGQEWGEFSPGQDLAMVYDDPFQGFLYWQPVRGGRGYELRNREKVLATGLRLLDEDLEDLDPRAGPEDLFRRVSRRIRGNDLEEIQKKGYFVQLRFQDKTQFIAHKKENQLTLYLPDGTVKSISMPVELWEISNFSFDQQHKDYAVQYRWNDADYILHEAQLYGPLGQVEKIEFDDLPGGNLWVQSRLGLEERHFVLTADGSYPLIQDQGKWWMIEGQDLLEWVR
jgi:hypothetical protein